MVRKEFALGVTSYMKDLSEEVISRRSVLPSAECKWETGILGSLEDETKQISDLLAVLAADTEKAETIEDSLEQAKFYQATVLADMENLRAHVDAAESQVPDSYLPYATYGQLLFSLR